MSKGTLIGIGCSHTVGSEIDGWGDSEYNRNHSFVAKLAKKLDYDHVNLGICGGSNKLIYLNTLKALADIENNSKKIIPHGKDHNYFFLIGWTSINRTELRYSDDNPHQYTHCGAASKLDQKIIPWCTGSNLDLVRQRDMRHLLQQFDHLLVDYKLMSQFFSAHVYSLQKLLAASGHKWFMFNAAEPHPQIEETKDLIDCFDLSRYHDPFVKTSTFYWYCRDVLGYQNVGRYWHLGEEAHHDWAEFLYERLTSEKLV